MLFVPSSLSAIQVLKSRIAPHSTVQAVGALGVHHRKRYLILFGASIFRTLNLMTTPIGAERLNDGTRMPDVQTIARMERTEQ